MKSRTFLVAATLLCSTPALVAAQNSEPEQATVPYSVDYEFAPAHWFTPIGVIDDWQKSMVDERGRLVYDFGPGPYARAKTLVSVGVAETVPTHTQQSLLDARTPVLITEHSTENTSWRQTAFSIIPARAQISGPMSRGGLFQRLESLVGSPAWTPDDENRDPAFRSVAWGTGRSIRYKIRTENGSDRTVALGFLEVYRTGRIMRLMDLLVEGAQKQTVDLVAEGGQNVPQVRFFDARDIDNNGWLDVEITGSPVGQDPNVFVNGIWVFDKDVDVTAEDVISGRGTSASEIHIDAGMELLQQGYIRADLTRTEVVGGSGPLQASITTLRPLTADTSNGTLYFDGNPFVVTDPRFESATKSETGWELSFPSDARSVDVLLVHGETSNQIVFPDFTNELRRNVEYWRDAPLPWGRMIVPDPDIQDLLDGGIRTLYQVRERVDGFPQFQPGASVYRGLWYGDGVWGAETVALIDDVKAARQMLDAMLQYQDDDGRTGVLKPALLHRETAHLIFGLGRYARLHQDWQWLDARWDKVVAAVDFLIDLRRQASEDPDALYYGLFPPGLTDGGVGGVGPSYGSVYWGLIGMAEIVRTAEAMDKPEAAAWRAEFDDFLDAFRTAAARDMHSDEHGHQFLPVKMDFDPEKDIAQRGQWGPIHSLYAGQFLDNNDPLIEGTMAMLDERTEEQQVLSLGWLTNGLWPIFEAHRALAYNWIGNPDKAEELLYSFANHATPTLLWVEEQLPKARGTKTAGDVPHTVGNMQVVRLVRYLLLLERDNNLEILGGLPVSWIRPEARLSLQSLPTHYGPTSLKLTIDKSGDTGTIWIHTPDPTDESGAVVLNLQRLLDAGFRADDMGRPLPSSVSLPWNRSYRLDFSK